MVCTTLRWLGIKTVTGTIIITKATTAHARPSDTAGTSGSSIGRVFRFHQ